jgi:hypothetical protein
LGTDDAETSTHFLATERCSFFGEGNGGTTTSTLNESTDDSVNGATMETMDPNIEFQRRQRRKRRWLWFILAIPAAIVIMVFAAIGWFAHRLTQYGPVARTLQAEISDARKEGLPLEPKDLRPDPPVPDSQNAAPIYKQITATLGKDKNNGKSEFADYVKGTRGPTQEKRVRHILRDRTNLLLLTERATGLPRCDFARPWEQGADLLLPEYAAMREIARMLAGRAILENADGQPLAALDTIAEGMRVAKHAGEDPVTIAALVQIAIMGIMDRPFREIVSSHIDDPTILDKALVVMKGFPPAPDMETAFRGEVVFCRVTVNQLRKNPSAFSLPLKREFTDTGLGRDVIDACEARVLSLWRRNYSMLRATRNDTLDRYRQLEVIGNELEHLNGKPTYELADILFPVLSQAQSAVLRTETHGRLRALLISLARYHERHRKFPDALSDVSSNPPFDPFTNKPLIYRRIPTGFILYSVGENFKDDGGKSKKLNKDDKDMDIVVEYPYRLDAGK